MSFEKVVTLHPAWNTWRVRIPDGRWLDVVAVSKHRAAVQASAIWGIPVKWLLLNASIESKLMLDPDVHE